MRKEMLYVRDLVKLNNKYVLNGVSFFALQGEILSFVGSHGAGISTLINILQGRDRCDSGSVFVEGKKHSFYSSVEANRAGIYRIDRTSLLVDEFDVAENICLTSPPVIHRLFVGRRDIKRKACELLCAFGVKIDIRKKVYELSEYERDAIGIIKVVTHGAKVLLLDNVMANYNAAQRAEMKRLITQIAASGVTVIFASTEEESIIDLADRIIVINEGRVEGTFVKKEYDKSIINTLMAPHRPPAQLKCCPKPLERAVLELRGFSAGGLDFPDLTVRGGEIVSFAGRAGQVDKTLIGVLRGKLPYTGRIFVAGKPVEIRGARDAMDAGIAYLTRYDSPEMLHECLSIRDNFLLLSPKTYAKNGFINRRMQKFACRQFLKDSSVPMALLDFFPRHLDAHMRNEVNLIKMRALKPKIVLLDDPFVNEDATMKAAAYAFIQEAVEKGACVIAGITMEIEQETIEARRIPFA